MRGDGSCPVASARSRLLVREQNWGHSMPGIGVNGAAETVAGWAARRAIDDAEAVARSRGGSGVPLTERAGTGP
jgi:hypothetical protein